ncbi:HNH endonuclease [Alkalihalobacillus sp. 1P02AB]|uniref:HNH endonuclease n=1 Tax=Alkalihalobacillus sp. 1P02AB TaxID=3132260 RepID=UPI0039A62627
MKYCGEQGCTKLITKGFYCLDHKRRYKRKKNYKHNNKKYYNSSQWDSVRSFVYQREKGLCQRCKKFVHSKRAHVHHVVPIKINARLTFEPNNLKLLCPKCHVIEGNEGKADSMPDYFK